MIDKLCMIGCIAIIAAHNALKLASLATLRALNR